MRLALVSVASLALAAALTAQNIPNPGDATSPAPTEPGHALIGEPHETVNPANGSLTVTFSIPLPPGRGGFTPAFTISYSSAGSHPFGSFGNDMANMYAQSSLFSSDGWSYGAPVLTYTTADIPLNDGSGMVCTTSSDYMAQMPDGSRQQLLLSDTGRASGNRPNPIEACDDWINETAGASLEGWAASTTALVDSPWRWEPVTLTSPDGTVLQFPNSGVPEFGALATTMTDRNGNQVAYSVTGGNALPSSPFALTLTDTLGRVLTTSGFAQPTDTITVPGMSSPYSVSWSSEPASGTVTVEGDPNGGPNTCPNTVAALHGGTAVTSITTPSGTYTFSYDPTWGVVDKITYPNGGYVRYVWGLKAETEPAELQTWNGSAYQACYARFDNPVITDRYVSPDGSTETEHQSFTYATTWGTSIYLPWTAKSTSETDTDSIAGTTRTIAYEYAPGAQLPPPNSGTFIAGLTPLESTVTTEDGGGNPLRVVTEAWDGPLLPPADRQTVHNGVYVSDITNAYNANGQIVERDEYHYPGGAHTLFNKTSIAYAAPGGNILDRPASETVYGGADGSTLAAQTSYSYDSTGNMLSLSRCVAFANGACDGSLASTYTYGSYGDLLTAQDPAGNTTTYDYTDNWNGSGPSGTEAYVTTITDALGHADRFSWNFAGGTLATHTGKNGNVRSYLYDAWDRLDQVNYPDGGETTYAYTPSTIETKRLIDTSGDWTDHLDTFDGLGRPIVSATETAPGQWSRVDTEYDGSGNRHFVTYPYYGSTGGAPADYANPGDTYAYDALDRETLATHSDGSTFITSYAGRATETQDEGNGTARVTRIAQDDGLGHLAAVCEVTSQTDAAGNAPAVCGLDQAGTGFLTTYEYDPLGNLTGVAQGAETRSFTYDGLARLLAAQNPESGLTTYTYDADSNVATRTRPAPNQTNPGVTVTAAYAYDALSRLVSVAYSDGSPARDFGYDQTSALGMQPLVDTIGRLSSESTGDGLTGEIFSYNAMGRIELNHQCTPYAPCGSNEWLVSYNYDLAGDVTEFSPPWGTLGETHDAAGRLAGLTSNVGDTYPWPATIVSGLTYDALGQETTAYIGENTGGFTEIAEARCYNARGELTDAAAAAGTTTPACTATSGTLYNLQLGPASDGQASTVIDSVNGDWSFAYDGQNRVASSSGTSASFAYAYDRYGNRWQQSVTAGSGPAPQLSFNAKNQMAGYSYDAAGNLLNDGNCAYTYNDENEVAAVAGCATASYVYNAGGQRVRSTVNGASADAVYDLKGRVVGEYGSGPEWNWGGIYANGRLAASYADSTTFFPLADQLGTPRVWMTSGGAVSLDCANLAFGDGATCTADGAQFTGQVHDAATGLDNFKARYYSPMLGRFLTPDWSASPEAVPYASLSNPQSLNLYSYVLNNPASATDADGHCPWCVWAAYAVAAAAVAYAGYRIVKATKDFQSHVDELRRSSAQFAADADSVMKDPSAGGAHLQGDYERFEKDQLDAAISGAKDGTEVEDAATSLAHAGGAGDSAGAALTQGVAADLEKDAVAVESRATGSPRPAPSQGQALAGPAAGAGPRRSCKEQTSCGQAAAGAANPAAAGDGKPGGGGV